MRNEARLRRLEADNDGEINGEGVMAALAHLQRLYRDGPVEDLVEELREQERSSIKGREMLTRPRPADRNGAIRYTLAELRSKRDERNDYVAVTAAIGRLRGIAGDDPKAWAKASVARASGPDGPNAVAILAAMEG